MPKTNKKSVKASKTKKQAKKPIAKDKKKGFASALMRSKTIMYTKKTSSKAPTTPAKSKAVKDWEPGYKKEILMFKSQPDYFQLNEKYKGL